MGILEFLQSEYGYNTPIFLNELNMEGMTDVAIRQALARLNKQGNIERFAQGVYYIPCMTPLGKSKLSAKKVYEKKYISDGSETYGYYCGLALENAVGLTTQMPNRIDIVTNAESSNLREVQMGPQKLRLRKSKIWITSENVRTLQFLNLLNQIDWNTLSGEQRRCILYFVRLQQIQKNDVFDYISYFPSRVAKTILESRLSDEFVS